MFTYFIFFIAGAITLRIFQFLLTMNPSFRVFKQTEIMILKIALQVYMDSLNAIKLSETVIEYSSEENKENAQKKIKLMYNTLINNIINNLKNSLPYKVEYSTLEEAVSFYMNDGEKNEH